jgi:hypothetical protein
MDFTREEQKILLQALYRFRGDVSGASQSEQNKYALVEGVISKIEDESGPLKAERTRFDREMEENLSVLGRGGGRPRKADLDNGAAPPKVESGTRARKRAGASAKAAKAAPARKGGSAKGARRAGAPKAGGAKGAGAKRASARRGKEG